MKDESGNSCYTRSQLDILLSGCVLGASAQHEDGEAAGAATAATDTAGAPAAPPVPRGSGTDDISSTTPSEAIEDPAPEATSMPEIPEPTPDEPAAEDPPPEPEPVQPASVEPANDNSPTEELTTTGTEQRAPEVRSTARSAR